MPVSRKIEGIQSLKERWQYFRLIRGDRRGGRNRRAAAEQFGVSPDDIPATNPNDIEIFLKFRTGGVGVELHRYNDLRANSALGIRPTTIEVREMNWTTRSERVIDRFTFTRTPSYAA